MKDELNMLWKEAFVARSRVYFGDHLKGLTTKTIKLSLANHPAENIKEALPAYMPEALQLDQLFGRS
jgi:hypothetical protein